MVNEIICIIINYVLVQLPKWGFSKKYFEENVWIPSFFYVLAAQQATFIFLITFLVSINRYIAVKCPTKYNDYFSRSNMIEILAFFIILSTFIGFGTIIFKPVYEFSDFSGSFIPYFTSKKVNYYQIFYTEFLFGIILIAICIFNVMAMLELRKHRQFVAYYKREIIYIKYSIFVFITLSLVEAFFVFKVIGMQYEMNILFYIFVYYNNWAFDLPFLGDFYFLIYSSRELKSGIKNIFKCFKTSTAQADVELDYLS